MAGHFDVCRVSTGDPVTAWQRSMLPRPKARRDQLNAWNLDHVHDVSWANGTDLTVGLADDAAWGGCFQQDRRRY